MPVPGDDRLAAVLRDIADQQAARLRDGTLPWSWWLERAARFGRRYGFTDTLLISAQWRAATDVRSYAAWRSAGRQVRKGETGIRLLSPAPGGGLGAVFDIAQTEGLPPERRRPVPPSEARTRLAALAARHGVSPVPEPGDDLGAVTLLAHRLAHALSPRDRNAGDWNAGGGHGCRGLRRLEADSVAFLVLARFGLETGHLAFPPAAGPYAVSGVGDRIVRLARRICAADPSVPDLLATAQRFFQARLEDGWVPAYLAGRGFPPSVQRRRRIGYAPPGPRALTEHLRARGHGDEALIAAGLARRGRTGTVYDTFRDRAMFAIRSHEDGTVAGFIGRRADGAPGPKYLNGPDTDAFHKGELLYGLHESRERLARGTATPVVVEGPLDAIAVDLASPAYAAVAICGLSLTAGQAAALGQVADLDRTGLVIALDGDPAGRSATLRLWGALRLWKTLGLWGTLASVSGPVESVRFPPDHSDPAGLLRDGGRAAVRAALRSRTPLMDVIVDGAIERAGGALATPEERLAAIRAATAVIARGNPSGAARQVARLAIRTNVPFSIITGELADTLCDADALCNTNTPCDADALCEADTLRDSS